MYVKIPVSRAVRDFFRGRAGSCRSEAASVASLCRAPLCRAPLCRPLLCAGRAGLRRETLLAASAGRLSARGQSAILCGRFLQLRHVTAVVSVRPVCDGNSPVCFCRAAFGAGSVCYFVRSLLSVATLHGGRSFPCGRPATEAQRAVFLRSVVWGRCFVSVRSGSCGEDFAAVFLRLAVLTRVFVWCDPAPAARASRPFSCGRLFRPGFRLGAVFRCGDFVRHSVLSNSSTG